LAAPIGKDSKTKEHGPWTQGVGLSLFRKELSGRKAADYGAGMAKSWVPAYI